MGERWDRKPDVFHGSLLPALFSGSIDCQGECNSICILSGSIVFDLSCRNDYWENRTSEYPHLYYGEGSEFFVGREIFKPSVRTSGNSNRLDFENSISVGCGT